MKSVARVSIVIPSYNSAAYLASTIASVRAQTFADWELVVFDDGSQDSSVEVAEEFARRDSRIRVMQGNHGGTSSARNGGLRETNSRSEYIAFLDSDDTWEPEALTLLVDALDKHPECPAAHGLARAVDSEGGHLAHDDLTDWMRHRREIRNGRYVDLPVDALTSFEAELVGNYVVTPGTSLIRRHILELLGGFASSTDPCEDWDLNIRIARRHGFFLLDRVILSWRRHPRNVSSTAGKRWRRAYFSVLKRAIASPENTPKQRIAAEIALRSRCRESLADVGQMLARRQARSAARSLVHVLLYISVYCRSIASSNAREVR